MNAYLEQLTIRLAVQTAALPAAVRQPQLDFVLSKQNADGGFSGRDGLSDPYYTSFGLRGLSMLGGLYGPPAERAADYLRSCLTGRETVVDFLALFYSAALLDTAAGIDIFENSAAGWKDRVVAQLESLRRSDGGYAKGPKGAAGSTYHSFLVLICLQLLEAEIPEPDRLYEFILGQREDSGGFREIRASKRGSTNPTAAAIAVLRSLDRLPAEVAEDAVDFLAEMQNDEGGLKANSRIPIADVLSTFTGLLTLQDLGGLDQIDVVAATRYVQSLEAEGGGFYAAVWDEAVDVEYTFYGLGALGILHHVNLL